MEAHDIYKKIQRIVGDGDLAWVEEERREPYLMVPREKLRPLAIALKRDQDFDFDTLMSLSGVHQTGDSERMEVVYHLFSIRKRHRFTFKVELDRPPLLPHFYLRLDTVSEIWPAAGWMEREIYDMFGIHFVGHQDFRRLLLPPDWEGHPLLKDYREPEAYRGISTTREQASP
ncbi:MAG TPA: NADH-quinone oxidoreductase subunit C [Syntrophobacteria bacterium]|nr:NADH-quinone oxidoreductase subunit C [Syntrophobacteria bacterium]